jgi:hypothetical protein
MASRVPSTSSNRTAAALGVRVPAIHLLRVYTGTPSNPAALGSSRARRATKAPRFTAKGTAGALGAVFMVKAFKGVKKPPA